jgi:hypothetical protein
LGHDGGAGKSNLSFLQLYKSAFTANHSGCFHGFGALNTTDTVESCHLSLNASGKRMIGVDRLQA